MKKETRLIIVFVLLSFLVPLLCFEAYVRYKQLNYTYEEQIGIGGYSYPYTTHSNSQRKPLYEPHQKRVFDQNEFVHTIIANSDGYNDREWSQQKTKKRILCLGDSFTEGRGGSPDSSYPQILQKIYRDSIEVYNAGIAGLDPFWSYKLLKEDLIQYGPDAIIVSVNTSDITDYIARGGLERFEPGYRHKLADAPWWNGLYSHSHAVRYLVRNVLKYNSMFLRPKQQQEMETEAKKSLMACADSLVQWGNKNHVEVYFLFQAMGIELTNKRIDCKEVLDYCNTSGYHTIDALGCFFAHGIMDKTTIQWPIDGHYNNKGYKLLAECVAQGIVPGAWGAATDTSKAANGAEVLLKQE